MPLNLLHNPLSRMDWSDFLGRPELPGPAPEALAGLTRRPILITGAGGSIGSALALRLAGLAPQRLILLDSSESNLYALERDWSEAGMVRAMTPILGSAGDAPLLDDLFATHQPGLVFHAAAFKHVPLMEAQPLAAIANNIFVTQTLVNAAAAHDARVVLLSTDKAVEPASVMGATKRVAEQIVLAAGGTALRLANVLASRDSVAEVFVRQIQRGGPLTVTSPAARRYFITFEEAVNLLLTAGLHPEPAALLAPALETPHFIADLARWMARRLAPSHAIAIEFTGSRPGDKESERLWLTSERTRQAGHDSLVQVESALPDESQFERALATLRVAHEARDSGAAINSLCALVPDYTPGHYVLDKARLTDKRVCR